jgi:hypothetical protein
MKITRRFKVLIYTVMNISTFSFSALAAIQGQMSIQRGLIIYLASALWINLLFWYVFRMNDKRSLKDPANRGSS